MNGLDLWSEPVSKHQHPADSLHDDSTVHCLKDFFSAGSFHGHVRNYFMSTRNMNGLPNYFANATGGGVGYQTARFKGFTLGLKGLFTYNTGSSDLTEVDPISGKTSKYEVQLFDVEHPENKTDLDRLEELFIDYRYRGFHVKLGKMDIVTPFVNPQDGRMKPYVLRGLYLSHHFNKYWRAEAGFFDKFSPRSTVHWYSAQQSIGIYNNGFNPNGDEADYQGKIITRGLGIAGLKFFKSLTKAQVWLYHIDNISNSLFTQFEQQLKLTSAYNLDMGLQLMFQNQSGNGGNSAKEFTYHRKEDRASLSVFKLGLVNSEWNFSLNYMKSFGSGRLIFPKEWGREQFFTTMSRGRIEGMGDLDVFVVKARYRPTNLEHLKVMAGFGWYQTPSETNYELNKYETPSHNQFTLDANYRFSHILEGLTCRFLYVAKVNHSSAEYDSPHYVNKSNFHHFNFVANIHF